jgi:hypothetical protein
MKRTEPDCRPKPGPWKTRREWTPGVDGDEEEDDDVDWIRDEQAAGTQPWESRTPLAFLPEDSLPPDHAAAVAEGRQWVYMDKDEIQAIASTAAYSKVCSALSAFAAGGKQRSPDARTVAAVAIDAVLEQEPSFTRCNEIVLEDGWAFSVAMWPGGRAFLVVACGPDRAFGWFAMPVKN